MASDDCGWNIVTTMIIISHDNDDNDDNNDIDDDDDDDDEDDRMKNHGTDAA